MLEALCLRNIFQNFLYFLIGFLWFLQLVCDIHKERLAAVSFTLDNMCLLVIYKDACLSVHFTYHCAGLH